MGKTLTELRSMNLERGHGVSAEEIAERMGEDIDFDHEYIATLSTRRFNEVINAYKKKIKKVTREETRELSMSIEDKEFLDPADYYLTVRSMLEIVIEALQYGSFRIAGEKSSQEKARDGKEDLLLYLAEISSAHIEALLAIPIEDDTEQTLDMFIESKRDIIRDVFFSYRKSEHSKDRYNRIFSIIRRNVKTIYEGHKRSGARAVKKGIIPLSIDEKIALLTQEKQKLEDGYKNVLKYIELGELGYGIAQIQINLLTQMNKGYSKT